jgi:hypothetical protein
VPWSSSARYQSLVPLSMLLDSNAKRSPTSSPRCVCLISLAFLPLIGVDLWLLLFQRGDLHLTCGHCDLVEAEGGAKGGLQEEEAAPLDLRPKKTRAIRTKNQVYTPCSHLLPGWVVTVTADAATASLSKNVG